MDKNRESHGSRNLEHGRKTREGQGGWGWLSGLLAGAVFLGIGAFRGELQTIWQKAVMICMECIGIG